MLKINNASRPDVWVCRCGTAGEYEDLFISRKIIGIEAPHIDGYLDVDDYRELKRKASKADYNINPRDISRLYRFTHTIEVGDYVLVPSRSIRGRYHVGIVSGAIIFNHAEKLCYQRDVTWFANIEKSQFSEETKNSIGSLLTLFSPSLSKEEIDSIVDKGHE